MSKKYFCDYCGREINESRKLSITGSDGGLFNIIKGNTSDDDFIHRSNFKRLDFCDTNHLALSLSHKKLKAVPVDENNDAEEHF